MLIIFICKVKIVDVYWLHFVDVVPAALLVRINIPSHQVVNLGL
jgi:hypothetical protein